MSYCVNCGVKLKDDADACPLCRTTVINPGVTTHSITSGKKKLKEEPYENTFDRNLWIKLITITLITPGVITLVIDWLFDWQLKWSLYVNLSLGLAWMWVISPFFFVHNRFIKWIPIGTVSMLVFLYLIEMLSNTVKWFFPLALPITLALFIIIAGDFILIKNKKVKELQIPAALLISIGIFCVCIDCALKLMNKQPLIPGWSLIVITSCLAFALVALVLQQRPWIVEALKHWFRM